MPVYNEPDWADRSLTALLTELARTPWAGECSEVIVVDDGSTDGTAAVLQRLAAEHPNLRVVRQDNGGRLAARKTGLGHTSGDFVLLLDSRVVVRPGSLAFLAAHLNPGARVWNGHVHTITDGNRYAHFWDAVARLAWWSYFRRPTTTSYGAGDFDRHPKGTGFFFAPRSVLVDAWAAFTTYYADTRSANDDTPLIRSIAERERIWLSPELACDYAPRQTLRQFTRHAHDRGVHFVDGHLRRQSRFAPVVVAFYPLSILAFLTGLWRWWAPPALLAAVTGVTAGAAAHRFDRRTGLAVASVTPAFVASFGAGMWKGAAMAVQGRVAS